MASPGDCGGPLFFILFSLCFRPVRRILPSYNQLVYTKIHAHGRYKVCNAQHAFLVSRAGHENAIRMPLSWLPAFQVCFRKMMQTKQNCSATCKTCKDDLVAKGFQSEEDNMPKNARKRNTYATFVGTLFLHSNLRGNLMHSHLWPSWTSKRVYGCFWPKM